MQRRRTQKILSMIHPENSGSSGNSSSDEDETVEALIVV
jgi:hypothetical protein